MAIKIVASLFTFFLVSIITFADSGYAFEAIAFMMKLPHGDKLAHFLLLGTLSLLINLSTNLRKISVLGQNVLLGSLLIAIGISFEEFSQIFIPHRNFEILDLVCNYAGIFTFGQLAKYYGSKKYAAFSI